MQREWMQHRFGWTLLALVPLALALLACLFGQVEIGDGEIVPTGETLAALLAVAALVGSTVLVFMILSVTSLIIISGLARRDHGDRSIEFWLSLPTGHAESLAVPLLVHLLLVPAAALLVGLAGGGIISLVLVARVAGIGEWLTLPWGAVLPAALAMTGRLLAGLPLALLWLSPLILLVVLASAWFRRWGVVVVAVGVGIGSLVLQRVFGQPLLSDLIAQLLSLAGRSLVHAGSGPIRVSDGGEGVAALGQVPGWVLADLGASVQALASPLLPGALLFAVACFALLVDWRRRGGNATA